MLMEEVAQLKQELENEENVRVEQNAMGASTGGGARDYELENMAKHQAGELDDAELGLANMKKAMGDPGLMSSIREMMKDPNTMAEVQKMMANPAFQAQAQLQPAKS